jgi:hypothetical protein
MLEDEAPAIGCGFRQVLVRFRGKRVKLHTVGFTATMMRYKFKELIASNKRYRKRNRVRPSLRLVVSNLPRDTRTAEAA